MYNPNFVTVAESWLKEDMTNALIIRSDFTTFRKGRFRVMMRV